MKNQRFIKVNIETIAQIGNEWKKHGHYRIYFEPLTAWFGLMPQREGLRLTGYILRGNPCSAEIGKEIIARLRPAKLYYDVTQGCFIGKDMSDNDFNAIVDHILASAQEENNE